MKRLRSIFESQIPKYMMRLVESVERETGSIVLGWNLNNPTVLIDRLLLRSSRYTEEDMLFEISYVPIHEIIHSFGIRAEW